MRPRTKHIALMACWLVVPVIANAGGPENVLVVVNADSQDSITIANHYIHLRSIPAGNVVYLSGVPQKTYCPLPDFKTKVLAPVIQAVNERGLANQIDCITWSVDFPPSVITKEHVAALESRVSGFNEHAFKPRASLNSATFFFRDFLTDNPGYMSMDANWYARRTVRDMLDVAFVGEVQEAYSGAINRYKQGNYPVAIRNLNSIVKDHPQQVCARYYLARALAQDEKTDEALKQLELCVKSGWCYGGFTRNDEAFSTLGDNERFESIVASMPNEIYGQLPTRGFESQAVWSRNGWINNDLSQGRQFVLSTALAMTWGRGNTLEQSIAHLKRSAAADGTHPEGQFIFTLNADIRTKARARQFPLAIKTLKEMGFRAEQIRPIIPKNRKDVIGASLGRSTLNWPKSGSTFAPGAICDNLTSHGGGMAKNATQTPCTHFLAHGASGVSGTVIEPLAIANKFPDAQIHVHYARGCTLAEAYYQSVLSPFQLLIIGDPLCRPFGNFPEFEVSGIENGASINRNAAISFKATDDSPPIGRFEVYLDGKKGAPVAPGETVMLPVNKLSDGYHELRVVAIEDSLIRTPRTKRIEFMVQNRNHRVGLQLEGSGTYNINRTIRLTANAPGATEIEIYQNSRVVGTLQGDRGELTLNCKALGEGPTTLKAVAMIDRMSVSSNPVNIQIDK